MRDMNFEFPGAVPEIPVSNLNQAVAYYQNILGFTIDWGGEAGGIMGISKGYCRMFLTDSTFRAHYHNAAPVVVWLNLNSKEQVDELYELWHKNQAKIVLPPDSKPWGLYEFTVTDPDGNLFRVFYDFATPEREKSS